MENTFIMKHLINVTYEMELKVYDDDNYYFETTGLIPLRWLYMIKDFYWIHSKIEELPEINYLDLLTQIPQITLNQILMNSKRTKKQYNFKVINSDDSKKWQTLNGQFSEYTKNILKSCNSFMSLQNTDNFNCYRELYAYEGGVLIQNKFLDDYLKFNHNYSYAGCYRNEMKGHDSYCTGKDVNHEEILCFYLALKNKGVCVSELEK